MAKKTLNLSYRKPTVGQGTGAKTVNISSPNLVADLATNTVKGTYTPSSGLYANIIQPALSVDIVSAAKTAAIDTTKTLSIDPQASTATVVQPQLIANIVEGAISAKIFNASLTAQISVIPSTAAIVDTKVLSVDTSAIEINLDGYLASYLYAGDVFTDAFSVADRIGLAVSKVLSDTNSFTDNLSFALSKVLIDSAAVTDALSYMLERPFSDSTTAQDAAAIGFDKNLVGADSYVDTAYFSQDYVVRDFCVTDRLAISLDKVLNDSFTLNDVFSGVTAVTGIVATKNDSTSFAETVSFNLNMNRQEWLYPYDTLSIDLSRNSTVDTATFSDDFTRQVGYNFVFNANDYEDITYEAADYTNRSQMFVETFAMQIDKLLTDTVTMTDNLDITGAGAALCTDTSTMNETLAMQVDKLLSDTATIAEALSNAFEKALSESSTVSDIAALGVGKAASDSSTVTDVSSLDFGKNINESVSQSETLSFGVDTIRADTATISEVLSKQIATSYTDTSTVTEVAAKDLGKLTTDSTTVGEVCSLFVSLAKSESTSISETFSKELGPLYSDTSTVSEVLAKQYDMSASDRENVYVDITYEAELYTSRALMAVDAMTLSFGQARSDTQTISAVGNLIMQSYFNGDYVLSIVATPYAVSTAITI